MKIYENSPYEADGQENNIPEIELYKAENRKSDSLMLICPGGWHGVGLAEDLPAVNQWVRLCQTWLIEHGFLNK